VSSCTNLCTELISPEDLLQACTIWQTLDVPVRLRKFDSGVMVIQSKSQSDDEVGLVSLDNFHLQSSCFVGICQMDERMTDLIS
jgi:hypothetical protein